MEDDVPILDIDELKKGFKTRLEQAEKILIEIKQQKRYMRIKGSHLLEQMLKLSSKFEIVDQINFYKVSHVKNKKRAIYISRRGGRVDLCGFSINDPLVVPLSRDEAKRRKLGRVLAQINFNTDSTDNEIIDVFKKVLSYLEV